MGFWKAVGEVLGLISSPIICPKCKNGVLQFQVWDGGGGERCSCSSCDYKESKAYGYNDPNCPPYI